MVHRPDTLELLAAWITVLGARDLADRTVDHYVYAVFRLLRAQGFRVHPSDLEESHVAVFLASLEPHASARHQYAKGIGSFTRYLARHGHLAYDPLPEISPRRRPRPDPVRYERAEIVRLLDAASRRDPTGRRRAAILAVLGLGARRTEFVNIRRADVDWIARVVHLRVTKGRKPRTVPIGGWAEEAIRELEKLSPVGQPYLLPVRPSTLNAWVHEAAVDAGVVGDRKQRTHTLRASYASYLLESGVPLAAVRDLLGHASVATTDRYLAAGPSAAAEGVREVLGGPLDPERETTPPPRSETGSLGRSG